jgi:hypothetical protein
MIELICAVFIGAIFGYISKKGNPTLNVELYNQVEKLKEEVAYYKDLCKWHADRNKK